MWRYIVRRILLQGIPVLLGFTFLLYLIITIAPGSPVTHLRGVPELDTSVIAQREAQLGLDQPFIVQYLQWLGRVIRLDLGLSFDSARRPVVTLIAERMPATVILSLSSIILGWGIGIPVGILSARYQYSIFDYFITFFAFVGISIPSFFFGLTLLYVFALKLNVLPAGGFFMAGEAHTFAGYLRYLLLPALTLGLGSIASVARYMRASLLEVLNEDYLRTARAKGLRERIVIYKHALRNALLPILTLMGFMLPSIFSGAVITENIFTWPGLGSLAIQAVNERNYPVIMGINLMFAVLIFLGSIIADVSYAFADPRIRYE
ncbi:MAG: ABC transporter permease [Bacillota bacterium]|jgi:peptide/nickel transport system permease protein|nr:ABC transporter permease [Bacillota bacterium]NLJ02273.1 ABC transporter permease [Bacillota bacterium]